LASYFQVLAEDAAANAPPDADRSLFFAED
jgi:hypothetical protein